MLHSTFGKDPIEHLPVPARTSSISREPPGGGGRGSIVRRVWRYADPNSNYERLGVESNLSTVVRHGITCN
jgi:hypothetical protein